MGTFPACQELSFLESRKTRVLGVDAPDSYPSSSPCCMKDLEHIWRDATSGDNDHHIGALKKTFRHRVLFLAWRFQATVE